VDHFLAASHIPIRVELDPERMRPSDIPRIECDYGRLHAKTGWRPAISFEQSLADILAYWRERTSE
jgi:GDP-4-dehydro-6-deoxy-D-mannose reductase